MSSVQTQNTYCVSQGYGDNRVVLLAKDPHTLYAYWEISNEKHSTFISEFGQEVWNKSHPVLKVTNVSKNESLYIKVNDSSNNWYINVPDTNCLYMAEFGRSISHQFFINLASSNYSLTPSECVSTDTSAYFVDYKTLKGGFLNIEQGTIARGYNLNLNENFTIGISSPELYGNNLHESIFGISSAELFGVNIGMFPGVSSESFIR